MSMQCKTKILDLDGEVGKGREGCGQGGKVGE